MIENKHQTIKTELIRVVGQRKKEIFGLVIFLSGLLLPSFFSLVVNIFCLSSKVPITRDHSYGYGILMTTVFVMAVVALIEDPPLEGLVPNWLFLGGVILGAVKLS